MALHNPNSLYTGGNVRFDATPTTSLYLQLISGDSKPAGSEWSGKDDLFYIKDVEIATKDNIAKIDLYNSFSSTFSNALAVLSTSLLQSSTLGVTAFGLPSKSSTAATNSGLLPTAFALW